MVFETDELIVITGTVDDVEIDVTPTSVRINDDEEAGIRISSVSTDVDEGKEFTYNVRLLSQPPKGVVVFLSVPENRDLIDGLPVEVTIPLLAWNTPKM